MIRNSDEKKRDMGITATFFFEGKYKNKEYGSVCGTLINEVVKRQMKVSQEKGEWWSHYFPTHEITGWSKEDLWENVKLAALQSRVTAKILVVDLEGKEKIINLK